ncbi:MAG TPA: hypothetical protein VHB72_04650 [Candidatus Saccharimonadales bacterium]|jgi:hypothetical protein|nr:hypothetical protein [Candidatus Saccharimonadales bacterium]
MKQLHIIYIPGIGDDGSGFQSKVVKAWRWWGVEPELWRMNWADERPWEQKFEEFLGHIDDLASQGKKVGLVGASAGASAVINAYKARPNEVCGTVTIAGKINRPQNIRKRYRRNNPSFVASAYAGEKSLAGLTAPQRRKILSLYGLLDEIIVKKDSKMPGAYNRLSPSIGHGITIATQIIFGAPFFIRFLKRTAKNLQ